MDGTSKSNSICIYFRQSIDQQDLCDSSLNNCLLQIEGAYVQGIGFFMLEEYPTNSDGLVIANGTWSYKIPTVDTIPKQFNVEILNSGHHEKRVLSSKGKFKISSNSCYFSL